MSAHREGVMLVPLVPLVRWLPWAEVALLSAWLGAALVFSAVVAPAAFAVLPSRSLAGTLVGRVLPVLFVAGMILGALLLSAELAWRRGEWSSWGARGAAIVMVASCAVAQFVIGARIARIRAAIGGSLEALPAGDPQRAAFGRLHAVSVAFLGAALLAALAAVVIVMLRERPHHRSVPPAPAPDLSIPVPSSR